MPFEVKSSTIKYSTTNNNQTNSILTTNKSFKGKKQITYQVKAGDNLYSIAQNYRVKITDLLQWNNLKNNRVQEGDILTINLVNGNPI